MGTSVYTSVSVNKVFPEVPDMMGKALIQAVLQNTSVVTSSIDVTLRGFYSKLEAMRKYSKRDVYSFGSPTLNAAFEYNDIQNFLLNYDNVQATWISSDFPTYLSSPNNTVELQYVELHSVVISESTPRVFNLKWREHIIVTVPPDLFSDDTESQRFQVIEEWILDYTEDGSIPELDNFQKHTDITVYPIVPLIIDGKTIDKVDAENFKDVKAILGKLPIQYSALLEGIQGTEDEPNPDIDKIDAAYYYTGININEEGATARNVMMDTLLYTANKMVSVSYPETYNPTDLPPAERSTTRLTFAVQEQTFSNEISYIALDHEIFTGDVPNSSRKENRGLVYTPLEGTDINGNDLQSQYQDKVIIFERNISDTHWERITVHGLISKHIIQTSKGAMYNIFESDSDNLLLPVIPHLLTLVPIRERNELAYKLQHLIIYSIEEVHLKWYQSSFFSFIVKGIGLILAVYTAGQSLAVAAAISGIATLTTIASLAGLFFAVDIAVQWLVENLGTIGLIIGIIAVLAINSGGLSNILQQSLPNILHNTLTATVRVIGTYQKSMFESIQESYTQFSAEYDNRLDSLREEIDALKHGFILDPMVMSIRTLPNININEEPSEFYKRTSSTLDLPAITYGMITHYHAGNLTLPKFDPYAGTAEVYNPNGGVKII